jgi:small-conductance mechanosensitive channel
LLVLVAAKLVLMSLLGGINRVHLLAGETNERYPGLDGRLRLYHPALSGVTRGLIYVLAAMALMQIYGAGALTWLWATTGGQRVVSGLVSLAVTILVAVAVWEMANAAIQRHLTDLMQDAQLARSSRLRTLLPLFRTTLLITIFIVAILMVLSEIGVNIAPLLAGAGILGVAIGFGSQKLVQDLITGIFLLLENALQVGDVVTVSGLSGSVEGLSVRTIRLRAGDGSIHIIPFSSVTSVTNLSRGVGNAEVRVTVDFEENTDRVAEVLAAIVAEMRAEPDFALKILKDFQLWGVDKVDGAGVTIAGQVVCTDSGRWSVQRAFNRRMKMRFQELDIRFFNQPRADMSG